MTPLGTTVAFDARQEKAFAARALATSRKAVVRGARVIAGGGVAAALAKEALASGVGMRVDFGSCDMLSALFGEGGPRALYFVHSESADKFLSLWDGYPVVLLGHAEGSSLRIGGMREIGLDELRAAHFAGGLL